MSGARTWPPALALTVAPSRAVPDTAGAAHLCLGGAGAIVAEGALVASPLPSPLLAVTVTRSRCPTSEVVSV